MLVLRENNFLIWIWSKWGISEGNLVDSLFFMGRISIVRLTARRMNFEIKMCALCAHSAPSAVAVRQHLPRARVRINVFFYTIGNEISYRIKKESESTRFSWEARAGFEPAIRVLQTRALPLGYHAISNFYKTNYIMQVIRTQAKE